MDDDKGVSLVLANTDKGIKALEDMEKAGELSGYKVVIDPNQNVLSTSQVEMVIKQVPVGVMRKLSIKIGFAASV